MGVVSWLSDLLSFSNESSIANTSSIESSCTYASDISTFDDYAINPASGLPMVGGIGGTDVAGNPYGTDFLNDTMSPSLDDSWTSSSFTNFGDS